MFDVGFSEMVVIGVVALVVLGPERLPKVARTLGVLFGRMQRYVAQVKSDIESQAADTERELRDATREIERSVSEGEAAAPPPGAGSGAASPQLELGIEEPAAPRDPPPAAVP